MSYMDYKKEYDKEPEEKQKVFSIFEPEGPKYTSKSKAENIEQ